MADFVLLLLHCMNFLRHETFHKQNKIANSQLVSTDQWSFVIAAGVWKWVGVFGFSSWMVAAVIDSSSLLF
jgi:hypothetical protein